MRRIRNLNRSTKLGYGLLLATMLVGGGMVVFDGGPSQGVEVLGASASLPPAPTITSGPSGPTSATAATFTYAGQNGVKFQCKLDTAAFSPCAKSGVTYTGLAAGPHTFTVAAQQGNGPLSAPAPSATRTWSVVTPTAAPTITVHPDDPTSDTEATFGFTGTGTFQCRLDGGSFEACASQKIYTDLDVGDHVFQVRAVNGGLPSSAVSFSWSIITGSFGIRGSLTGVPLAPGTPAQPLDLEFTNPYNNSQGIDILGVTITVQHATLKDGALNELCDGPANLVVTPGSPAPWPVNVPRDSTRSLSDLGIDPARWPQVQMRNLDTNQDACKNTTFNFTYTGTATK